MKRIFTIYLLPGFVFQSVLIGGGYGTGREIVEFFLTHGPIGGLLAMGVTIVAWCFLLAVAFEFARQTEAYDYRSFFMSLIGPFWRLFEVAYLLLALLVIAVVGSAAGEIMQDTFSLPGIVGSAVLLTSVGVLALTGSRIIERFLSLWSVFLYIAYGVLLFWILSGYSGEVNEQLASGERVGNWGGDGLLYAAYNFVVLAPLLFALRHIKTRRQAFTAGILASFIGMVPAVFLFVAMLSQYPAILDAPVPAMMLLTALDAPWFQFLFQIVLFGTFIETGVGLVHSINQRIAGAMEEQGKTLLPLYRFLIALGILVTALFLADALGVITLISKGYSYMSYLFLAIVVLPLATIGARRAFLR